ncbi:X-ray repair cross-complementing protein 5-like [Mizuhopecten yessoensis]|uniref:X-ray repair cross-complementing protein 5-like n=1 Tax=Mizuhopecten yessoensis TaxID=6573 RepID=UPI000B45D18D|nr:X-ray repair cross-complementing protein 5-like [Mizuhopecten yessoensis]
MAANKEAIAIVVDVGPSMNQAPEGETTALQTAIEAITMIVQRKVFAESKDEVAVILFGTADTDNPLANDESYENITILRPLGIADFDLLNLIQNDIQPSNMSADYLDALVVGIDHLVNATQGKKGFGFKRLILMSDLGGEFGDDQIDTIINGIKGTGTELNVIGPSLDDEDDNDSEKPGPSTISNGHRKERTAQQRAGEAMLRHILQEVDGECYSFSEALPALSSFQSRQIKQTAWKCQLEITSGIRIPICSYAKLKDFKLKQSWKRVYAKEPSEEVGTLRTYHMNDEEETEVDREDMIEGHRYGNTLVPMSEDDKANMKYKAEKCFKILGFTKPENVKRSHYLGDGSSFVVADKGDEAAAVALSSLVQALYETNMVAIVRKVYNAASGPKLGCLIPHIKADYECLLYVELPFMEDVRQFTFGSLPITKDNISTANSKFAPSDKQLDAVDKLITTMDLCQSQGDEEEEDKDEEEEQTEYLKAKSTFNPHFQRLYQCLQHRGLNPDEPLAELSPLVANYLEPPQEILSRCEEHLERLNKVFKLEVVKKKEEKTGENQFKESDEGEAGKAKKPRLDDDLEGGMADITRAKVTEVGTVTPVEDFVAFINQKDEDKFEEASQQMQKRVEQIVLDSFGAQFYPKAMDCLQALRKHSIKKSEPGLYNTFMKKFKDVLIAKGRRDFWEQVVAENQGLISKMESEESTVSNEEAKQFVSEEEEKDEEEDKQDEGDDADDLLDMM